MCLLKENVSLDWKCTYWMKKCLLNENVSINWKCTYWMKKCLLKSHNHLGINSCLYSFDNFFLTSYLSSFLETLETCGYSAKLLFVSRVFFFFFFFCKIVKRSKNHATPILATIILNDFFTCFVIVAW